MAITDIIDGVTNTIGDAVDATSSAASATPGIDVDTPSLSYFDNVDDALNNLGSELKSPAFSKVDEMKAAGESLNVMQGLNETAVKTALGSDGDEVWNTLKEVQSFSDSLNNCGQIAQDALLGATKDYIKNTGIQQAGRDLAKQLGKSNDLIDCAAGFATLFDSAGIMEDALGAGDLPQIQNRVASIIRDVTNPNKIANVLVNTRVVQDLLGDFQGMCDAITAGLKELADKDIAAMNAAINKLAQWAAFAKMATSDPCALVNNKKMLEHIAEPVMDDIVALYNQATNSQAGPDNPIISVSDIKNALPSVPKFIQKAGEGLPSLNSVANTLSGSTKSTFLLNAKTVGFQAQNQAIRSGKATAVLQKVSLSDGSQVAMTDAQFNSQATVAGALFGGAVGGLAGAAVGAVAANAMAAAASAPAAPASGASTPAKAPPPIVAKDRTLLASAASEAGEAPAEWSPSKAENDTATNASSGPLIDNKPFAAAMTALASIVTPPNSRTNTASTGAVVQANKEGSQIGGSINQMDQAMEEIDYAFKTGDFSKIETCVCKGGDPLSSGAEECKASGGTWSCKKGTATSGNGLKSVFSAGKFTNKTATNVTSKLPSNEPFDVTSLPSLNDLKFS